MAFARIGIFQVGEQQFAPVLALFRDSVTPIFATYEGFVGYQAFVDRGAGRYIGISYWTSLAALEASAPAALRAREQAELLGAQIVGEPMIAHEEFDTRGSEDRD
jgi:hypothetical protein